MAIALSLPLQGAQTRGLPGDFECLAWRLCLRGGKLTRSVSRKLTMPDGGVDQRQCARLTVVCATRRKGPSKRKGSESKSAESSPVEVGSVTSDWKVVRVERTRLYGFDGTVVEEMEGGEPMMCPTEDESDQSDGRGPSGSDGPGGVCAYVTGVRDRSVTLVRTARADKPDELCADDEGVARLLGRASERGKVSEAGKEVRRSALARACRKKQSGEAPMHGLHRRRNVTFGFSSALEVKHEGQLLIGEKAAVGR